MVTGECRVVTVGEEAEEKGEVKIERQEVVINEPFLIWPGAKR